ncbi:MAG: lipocalin family protein [Acidobacteriota bacterium]|nr:lipocalin family protein [Acidobacteriota bacterium]
MNRTSLSVLSLLLAFAVGAFAQSPGKEAKLTTVGSVDLDRYEGKWYEIARYPNRFQKKCVGDTTATYTIKKKGIVEVINECRKENGKMDRAKGKAKVIDKESNAKLKVRFAPAWLSFIPAVWGDYWIIDLDEDNYGYAVIGDPSRKYLWILSRTPKLEEETYSKIVQRIESNGFDPEKLIMTPQEGS